MVVNKTGIAFKCRPADNVLLIAITLPEGLHKRYVVILIYKMLSQSDIVDRSPTFTGLAW